MSILQLSKISKFDEIIHLLQQTQYDVKLLNQQDHGGRCALHYAVLSNQKLVCQQLLKSGASPNVQDGQGNTALHLSLSSDKPNNECIQILCTANYDWKLQDVFGRTALHWICSLGLCNILKQITLKNEENEEKMNDVDMKENNVWTAFNLQNKSGQTCMHWAVDKQQWKCVHLLLEIAENGLLDLTIKDKDGLLAFDLCLNEATKQMIWDKMKVQIQQKEKKKKENAIQKFAVNTNNAKNKKKKPLKIKVKGKGKKKMKIKLKKIEKIYEPIRCV